MARYRSESGYRFRYPNDKPKPLYPPATHSTKSSASASTAQDTENSEKLGSLFHSLPTELREEIFGCLLVRPVKWALRHKPTCPKPDVWPPHTPIRQTLGHYMGDPQTFCASQLGGHWVQKQGQQDESGGAAAASPWLDPWRSEWAPPKTNPYVCARCYDDRLRPAPAPRPHSLPCLCARRDGLQVLLVCRQWYAEAARVFYARNVFAFAAPRECVDFVAALRPQWRDLVARVSLLALPADDAWPDSVDAELEAKRMTEEDATSAEAGLAGAWAALRQLPALAQLELDAVLLTDIRVLRLLLREPALEAKPLVRFVQCAPYDWQISDAQVDAAIRKFIWPQYALPIEVQDSDLADRVTASIRDLANAESEFRDSRSGPSRIDLERVAYRQRGRLHDLQDVIKG